MRGVCVCVCRASTSKEMSHTHSLTHWVSDPYAGLTWSKLQMFQSQACLILFPCPWSVFRCKDWIGWYHELFAIVECGPRPSDLQHDDLTEFISTSQKNIGFPYISLFGRRLKTDPTLDTLEPRAARQLARWSINLFWNGPCEMILQLFHDI